MAAQPGAPGTSSSPGGPLHMARPSKDSPHSSKVVLLGARFLEESEAPHRSSQARGRGNEDAAALRVEPRRTGGRRKDSPDLRSGCATRENCNCTLNVLSEKRLESLQAQFQENNLEFA